MVPGSMLLIGGGWSEASFPHTYRRFAAAIDTESPRIACILLDEPDREEYFARFVAAFAAIGVVNVHPVFVSPDRPLRHADVDGAEGILIGGGLTLDYHDAILPDAGSWLPLLIEEGMPYAGFSAGSMIAPAQGIIGGWKLHHGTSDIAICSEDVSEDKEYLDIRPGLGLVPFAVDVHASQYGTVALLLHAVQVGQVPEGWPSMKTRWSRSRKAA